MELNPIAKKHSVTLLKSTNATSKRNSTPFFCAPHLHFSRPALTPHP